MIIHGDSRRHYKTKLYNTWKDMMRKCNNKNRKDYHNYGGRGIKVCDEWKNSYIVFKEWALANGYKNKLPIDRIDNY